MVGFKNGQEGTRGAEAETLVHQPDGKAGTEVGETVVRFGVCIATGCDGSRRCDHCPR